nr:hypothetical protein [Corynebacterium silvaticum]
MAEKLVFPTDSAAASRRTLVLSPSVLDAAFSISELLNAGPE